MLEIVQFDDGRYGLRNAWTGIVLPHEFRTIKGASRKRRRINRRFNRVMRNLSSKHI